MRWTHGCQAYWDWDGRLQSEWYLPRGNLYKWRVKECRCLLKCQFYPWTQDHLPLGCQSHLSQTDWWLLSLVPIFQDPSAVQVQYTNVRIVRTVRKLGRFCIPMRPSQHCCRVWECPQILLIVFGTTRPEVTTRGSTGSKHALKFWIWYAWNTSETALIREWQYQGEESWSAVHFTW
jgi:hypothetical protein